MLYQRYEASRCDDRIFIHTEYPLYHEDGLRFEDGNERPVTGSQRWTWELFPAHFADGKGPDDIFVGRWPD
ncbi:hypothetical protein [Mycolicibacter heraklionensis]|uniref:hypothetical protein n=1 Tax=Mycolicibacter heraklionensis TaxID=512402 RepID=UPI001A96A08F|nr:hypothetical protein [Mycolicibacter heraklionensis]